MDAKICLECNKKIIKTNRMGLFEWDNKKFCSQKCKTNHSRGIFIPNSGHFKMGMVAWNKNKTGYMSDKGRKNIAEASRIRMLNESIEHKQVRMKKIHEKLKKNGYRNGRLGNKGELDPNWKGENATYSAKHRWIQNNWQKTGICELCFIERPPRKGTRLKWGTHWANKSGEYKRERNDWYELCPKCHKSLDKR